MRAAERGQVVVEGFFIRYVDHRDASAPFVPVAAEEVVVAHGEIK